MQYIKYKNWYTLTRYKLIKKYRHKYKLMAGLIASVSPQYNIKRNYRIAKNIYNDYIKDKKTFIYYIKDKDYFIVTYNILPCHYNNILKCILYDIDGNKNKLVLNGNKVNNFYNNLIGHQEYITIDTWMLKYFKHTKAWLNKSDYVLYSKYIIKYTKHINKRHNMRLKYSQVQAILWIKQRIISGYRPVSFVDYI